MIFKKKRKRIITRIDVLEFSTSYEYELKARRPVLTLTKRQIDEQKEEKRKRLENRASKVKRRDTY